MKHREHNDVGLGKEEGAEAHRRLVQTLTRTELIALENLERQGFATFTP